MKKFIAPVVVLCAMMISSTASAAADWVWLYSDNDCTIYFDNNSIRRDRNYSGYVFHTFVKWVYSDKGCQKEIERRRSNGRPLPRGIYNFSYSMSLWYFKEENRIKYCDVLNCVFYDNKGNVIPNMGFSYDVLNWQIIPPDTIAEWIFDAVHVLSYKF